MFSDTSDPLLNIYRAVEDQSYCKLGCHSGIKATVLWNITEMAGYQLMRKDSDGKHAICGEKSCKRKVFANLQI
jgi:hypothetical protein